MKVLIKYGFILDPDQTWQRQTQFNEDLAIFFKDKGFDVEMVESANNQESLQIFYLKKCKMVNVDKTEIKFSKDVKPTS